MFMLNVMLLASAIVLVPDGEYLGELNIVKSEFWFGPGTILAPKTRLGVSPFLEEYGAGSHIPRGSGGITGTCLVPSIDYIGPSGYTYIHCDIKEKYK